MKRIHIPIIMLLCLLLSGCVSKEAQLVIDEINALGTVTLDSFRDLQEINIKYGLLSEKDKQAVSNVEVLEAANFKYNELKYEDLNRRIGDACKQITAESLKRLEQLLTEYENLSDDGKKYITNYEKLEEAIDESRVLLANKMTDKIISYANGSLSDAKYYLSVYKEIMTDAQITDCMLAIGRFGAVSEAEEYLKNYLKNPLSYVRYSGKVGRAELQADGSYEVFVYLNYGAENSFGASVREEVEMYVYFMTNSDETSITYLNTKLTPRYAWVFAS